MPTKTVLNANGQPVVRKFNQRRRVDRSMDELFGICKGLIADRIVNQDEAEFLLKWIDANAHVQDEWPACVIYPRIYEYLKDGVLDQEEQRELFDLLSKASGEIVENDGATVQLSTTLPFDDPAPPLSFDGSKFCLTGHFAFGSRQECADEILNLGGWVDNVVSYSTNYLVVGTLCSRHWAHANYGRKIEKALNYNAKGGEIVIVSEDHWAEYLIGI